MRFFLLICILLPILGNDFQQQFFQQDLETKVYTGIFLISAPSLPVFIIIQLLNQKIDFKKSFVVKSFLSFCFALILGDALFHMLPEVKLDSDQINIIVFGILLIWFIEMIIINVLKDAQNSSKAITFLIADFIHNFIDGIAIGASFLISDQLGYSTVIATALHEIPHELSDFTYLIFQKYSAFSIFKTQIFTSLGAFLGAYVGLRVGNTYKQELLALSIGVFLNNSLYGLLPEITEGIKDSKTRFKMFLNILANLISLSIGFYVIQSLE